MTKKRLTRPYCYFFFLALLLVHQYLFYCLPISVNTYIIHQPVLLNPLRSSSSNLSFYSRGPPGFIKKNQKYFLGQVVGIFSLKVGLGFLTQRFSRLRKDHHGPLLVKGFQAVFRWVPVWASASAI